MPLPHYSVALLLGWLLFHRLVVHRGWKDLLDRRPGSSPFTTWVVVVETMVMATVSVAGGWLGWHPPSTASLVAGNLGLVLACAVGLWSRRTLGRHFSIHLTTDHGHELVTSGPYRWVRHPVYAGDLLFHLSVPLVTSTYEALVFAPLYFLLVRSRMEQEEAMLSREYGDYAAYMTRTTRLLPGLY